LEQRLRALRNGVNSHQPLIEDDKKYLDALITIAPTNGIGTLKKQLKEFRDEITFVPNFPLQIDLSFNPFIREELNSASNELRNAGLTLVKPEVFLKPQHPDYGKWYKAPKKPAGGIFYRPPIPYTFKISDSLSNVVSATVLLPNISPTLHLDIDKAAFVASVSQVTLTNGFISSYSLSKPSSALALATIPLTLLSDITSSVTNLVQFRLNVATGKNNLQSAANANQSAQTSAFLAQQAALITQLSNNIAILNLTQTLKAMTNTTTGTTNH
jgi:hypothetical protein